MRIFRLALYLIIWVSYIAFISTYSPLGSDWLDWHSQRVNNAVQFLELNGFMTAYGFTIWSDCTNCQLNSSYWNDKIYFSTHGFSLLPYIAINYFFGVEGLLNYAHLSDKLAIFLTAVILSELSVKFFNNLKISKLLLSLVIFSLFVINPWTYKMIISGWTEIYFILFFLLGVYFGISNCNKISIVLFFFAGLFNFVWSIALAIFYLLINQIPIILKDRDFDLENFLPSFHKNLKGLDYFFALFGSVISIFIARFLANRNYDSASSTSLLERIGISGVDIHNGGILGALQFLGGNRVTQCVFAYEESKITSSLNLGIKAYNCILSISSLLLLSLLSIAGVIFASIQFPELKKIVAPLSFSLLFLLLFFQQSFSVHLMGYSYIFSIIFSLGIGHYLFKFLEGKKNISIRYIFAIPIFLGILILCIRVSMLTGANG
jgi:hypothetical protein